MVQGHDSSTLCFDLCNRLVTDPAAPTTYWPLLVLQRVCHVERAEDNLVKIKDSAKERKRNSSYVQRLWLWRMSTHSRFLSHLLLCPHRESNSSTRHSYTRPFRTTRVSRSIIYSGPNCIANHMFLHIRAPGYHGLEVQIYNTAWVNATYPCAR